MADLSVPARLTGIATAWTTVMAPLAYTGVYGATAWTAATVLNSEVPTPALWGAATLTMVLAVVAVAAVRTLIRDVGASATQSQGLDHLHSRP